MTHYIKLIPVIIALSSFVRYRLHNFFRRTSGSIRAFGLDCSGFVTWAFNNSGMGFAVGHGTIGQKGASTLVSASTVQAGDLAFVSDYSHVGIVVGQDTRGNILVIHCSSGANNVVLATASSVGFNIFRRPNCY